MPIYSFVCIVLPIVSVMLIVLVIAIVLDTHIFIITVRVLVILERII